MNRKTLSGHDQPFARISRVPSALAMLLFWVALVALSLSMLLLRSWFATGQLILDGSLVRALLSSLPWNWPVWLSASLLSVLLLRSHWRYLDSREQLARLGRLDPLTGVANRIFFEEMAQRELRRAEREGHELSLLLIAVDRLRDFNDRRGRQFGDLALQAIAETVQQGLRDLDLMGRLDGDEFLVLVKGGPDVAQMLGERVRQAIATISLPGVEMRQPELTVSIGHSSSGLGQQRQKTLVALLADAEIARYAAKDGGRDQVVGFSSNA